MKKTILIALSFLFVNCGSDNNVTTDADEKMIKNIVENIIKPEETKFYNDAIQLQELTNKFVKIGQDVLLLILEKLKKEIFSVGLERFL